jgi:hypothetical protein
MSTENEITQIEVLPASTAMDATERATIDMQISTAKRYPRSIGKVKNDILSFATLDIEVAESCFYRLPMRKGSDGKAIEGPSVRLAEIALSCFTNIKAQTSIIADDGKMITARAVVYDMQNNVTIAKDVTRSVLTRQGMRFSNDMIATTMNAAQSLALRNATFTVIPAALIRPAFLAAKQLAVGDIKSLSERRGKMLEQYSKIGVVKEEICAVLGVAKVDDINLDHMEELIGYFTAIKDGNTTVDEVFRKREATQQLPESKPVDIFNEETPV